MNFYETDLSIDDNTIIPVKLSLWQQRREDEGDFLDFLFVSKKDFFGCKTVRRRHVTTYRFTCIILYL